MVATGLPRPGRLFVKPPFGSESATHGAGRLWSGYVETRVLDPRPRRCGPPRQLARTLVPRTSEATCAATTCHTRGPAICFATRRKCVARSPATAGSGFDVKLDHRSGLTRTTQERDGRQTRGAGSTKETLACFALAVHRSSGTSATQSDPPVPSGLGCQPLHHSNCGPLAEYACWDNGNYVGFYNSNRCITTGGHF